MPDKPSDTVTAAGVADILGCARSAVYRDHLTTDGFPDHVEDTPLGRRWLRSDVEAYAAARKPTVTEEGT